MKERANNALNNRNNPLSRPLKAINSKSTRSKASCPSGGGLLSKNGSQVKLIDLEDEDEDMNVNCPEYNSIQRGRDNRIISETTGSLLSLPTLTDNIQHDLVICRGPEDDRTVL